MAQLLQPISTNRTSVLLLATGLSVGVAIPTSVAGTASPSPASQNQLISQKPQPVELTLVSYAVTKAAHDKIIPLFQEK